MYSSCILDEPSQGPTLCDVQVYEFNVPTFGKGVVFDVDHKVKQLLTTFKNRHFGKSRLCNKPACVHSVDQHAKGSLGCIVGAGGAI